MRAASGIAALAGAVLVLAAAAPPGDRDGTARPVRFEAVLEGRGTGGGRALLAAVHDAAAHGLDARVVRFVPDGQALASTLVIDGRLARDVRAAAADGVRAGMRLVSAGPVTPPSDATIRRVLHQVAIRGEKKP